MIDVSVIIPCYNTEQYLAQCLKSVLANDSANIEVLCINDGSTDGSLKVMQEIAETDRRIRIIDKKNQGYGATVNRGIDEAKGAYIAIVEPDDYLKPHMYDDLVKCANYYAQPQAGEVAGESKPKKLLSARELGERGPDIVKSSYWRIVDPLTSTEHILHCAYWSRIKPPKQPFVISDVPRLLRHHPSIWSALYRRSFLNENKIRFKEVPGAGWVDNPFLVETLCQAKSIVYTDRAYYCYRENLPGSSSAAKNVWLLSIKRWNDMEDILDRLNIEDFGVRKAMDTVLFRYSVDVLHGRGLDDPDANFRQTLSRLRPECVAKMHHIRPSFRAFLLREGGLPVPKMSYLKHYRSLLQEFFYVVRTNGIAFALVNVFVFFWRMAKRLQ